MPDSRQWWAVEVTVTDGSMGMQGMIEDSAISQAVAEIEDLLSNELYEPAHDREKLEQFVEEYNDVWG